MNNKDLINRFELLYPTDENLSNLRRAYCDRDLNSIFKLVSSPTDIENLRKFVLEDNEWSMFKLLAQYKQTQFVTAFKSFLVNGIKIHDDCFSQGQILSKRWLIEELIKLNLNLGTVFLCAGWYGTLATMIFENEIKLVKIRSFDQDPTCQTIAEIFNKPWVMDDWKFKSVTKNILDINYTSDTYEVTKSNGETQSLSDSPDTIINTSCEHITNFDHWYNMIPTSKNKLLILQSNNYFEITDHVNCASSLDDFSKKTPMTTVLYEGELKLEKYTRYMRIGIK